jgi:hypothetical protein
MTPFDSSSQTNNISSKFVASNQPEVDSVPPVGVASPLVLAEEAAAGSRGSAWRFLYWIIENDPRAIQAFSALSDERLAQNIVEFIALGTWAGRPFAVPAQLRTPYARTRLRTLFVSLPDGNKSRVERVLLADIHDQRPAVRETAIYILGIIGSTVAIPELLTVLHDPLLSTRLQAAKALGRTGSAEVVFALLDALHGADEQLGSQIFMALVNLGHKAVPALLNISQSSSSWLRWHSIRALAEIRDPRAFPVLVQALTDKDHSVAWMAAKGLAPFGKNCIEPLLHLLITTEMTPWLVETASYVLHYQCQNHAELKPFLEPVIQQMHQSSYRDGTGYAALHAQEQLQASGV